MTDFYKIKIIYAPPIMHSLLQFRENRFNIRNFQKILTKKKDSINYGTKTVSYWAANFGVN